MADSGSSTRSTGRDGVGGMLLRVWSQLSLLAPSRLIRQEFRACPKGRLEASFVPVLRRHKR